MNPSCEKQPRGRRIAVVAVCFLGGLAAIGGCSELEEKEPRPISEEESYSLQVDVHLDIEIPTVTASPTPTSVTAAPPAPAEATPPKDEQHGTIPPTTPPVVSPEELGPPVDAILEEPVYEGTPVEAPDFVITTQTCFEEFGNQNPFPEDFRIAVDIDEQVAHYSITDESGAVIDGGVRLTNDPEAVTAYFCSPFGDAEDTPLEPTPAPDIRG